MCKGVHRKVFPYRCRWNLCAPAEGEVDGEEAYCQVPGRVLGPERGKRGEGLWESGRGRVGAWGGAGNSEGGEAPLVSAVRDNGSEASLTGQDGSGGEKEVVRGPSLDPVPEAIHALERSIVWWEEVCSVSEYVEEEATGDAVAEEWSDAGPWGGEAFEEGEDLQGEGKAMPVMVGRVERRGEPISQPSDYLGGPEEVVFQFDWGMRGRCPLAGGPPVD